MKHAWMAATVCVAILLAAFLASQTLANECEEILLSLDNSIYAADHGQADEAWDHLIEATGLWEARAIWWHLFAPQDESARISALFIAARETAAQGETLFFDVSAAQLQDALYSLASDQQLTLYNVL